MLDSELNGQLSEFSDLHRLSNGDILFACKTGWQLREYNIPKVAEAIAKAPEYGVNFLILSHGLFDNTERVLNNPQLPPEVLPADDVEFGRSAHALLGRCTLRPSVAGLSLVYFTFSG